MFKKNIIFSLLFFIFLTSCNSWDSVKRGLTGAKEKSTDEFLVKKKDPLILPPDFDSLPTPRELEEVVEETSTFEEKLKTTSSIGSSSSESDGTEKSILEKIKQE